MFRREYIIADNVAEPKRRVRQCKAKWALVVGEAKRGEQGREHTVAINVQLVNTQVQRVAV